MATRAFCTIVDRHYLVRAVAMYRSLARQYAPADVELALYCVDDDAHHASQALNLPGVRPLHLVELEAFDPGLARVRPSRRAEEYYWTATPCLLRHQLAVRPDLDEVTYLDADLLFFSPPEPLFAEMDGAHILITPHRFARCYENERRAGIYNVQFLTVRRGGDTARCLDWWRERCLEWCHHRVEDGKFGDQRYLDDWPQRFAGVHVVRHPGSGLGPWNIPRHELRAGPEGLAVDGEPLVFVHYSGVSIHKPFNVMWRRGGYVVDRRAQSLLLTPYAAELRTAMHSIRTATPTFSYGFQPLPSPSDRAERFAMATATYLRRTFPPFGRVQRALCARGQL